MADPTIPASIKVDPQALYLLGQTAGVQERPAIESKGEEHLLHRNSWEQWTDRNKKFFKWPSFVELFKAQGNDDTSTSLSIEDLQLKTVSHPKRNKAERAFVKAHGYPEAVIMDGSRQIVRQPDGQFWMGHQKGGQYEFKQIARHEGREIEARIANTVLENLDSRFNMASPAQRLYMKSTMGMGRSRSAAISSGGGSVHRFADKDYRFGNSNAKIAYKPGGDVDRYFLYQPQNGCVAASILNGAIFSESGIPRNPALLIKFYKKLKGVQDSTDGRIDVELLVDAIGRGEIPGLTARPVSTNELEKFVRAKKPVVALVPYFFGHAFLVTDVNAEAGYYKAVDTVSGMMVQERYRSYSNSPSPNDSENAEDGEQTVSDHAREEINQIDVAELRAKLLKILRDSAFQRRLQEMADPSYPGDIGGFTHTYYSFEIQDAKKFLAWLDS